MVKQERSLPTSSALFESISEGAHVIVRDPDDRIIFWSERDGAIYDWLPSEALDRNATDLLGTEYPASLETILDDVRHEGKWEGEIVHHRRDGSAIHVRSAWRAMHDAGGDVSAFIEINEEISREELEMRVRERTEALAIANDQLNREIAGRVRVAAKLAQANQTLTTLIDAAPVAIIALDDDRLVEIWNPEAARQFGIPASTAQGLRFDQLPIEWSHPMSIDALFGHSRGHIATRIRTPEGNTRELTIWSAPMSDGGQTPGGHVLLSLDETEKRFLEGALLEAGEREQRRIGQELHEHLCQHLLGAAFGAQALAREFERTESPVATRARELARLINDSVLHARNLARGINPIESDPASLLSALQEMAVRVPAGINMTIDCDTPLLVANPEVATHVFRIVQDAVTNALAHGNADHIRIRLRPHDNEITLEVSDNGRKSATEEPRDLNLGMEIMKYRARAIDAGLKFEFRADRGTTVTCTFANR